MRLSPNLLWLAIAALLTSCSGTAAVRDSDAPVSSETTPRNAAEVWQEL